MLHPNTRASLILEWRLSGDPGMRRVAPPEWGSIAAHQILRPVEKLRDRVDGDRT